eukprot:SAG31_NODE_299_length_18114_cov_3.533777_3_plen_952_part_00
MLGHTDDGTALQLRRGASGSSPTTTSRVSSPDATPSRRQRPMFTSVPRDTSRSAQMRSSSSGLEVLYATQRLSANRPETYRGRPVDTTTSRVNSVWAEIVQQSRRPPERTLDELGHHFHSSITSPSSRRSTSWHQPLRRTASASLLDSHHGPPPSPLARNYSRVRHGSGASLSRSTSVSDVIASIPTLAGPASATDEPRWFAPHRHLQDQLLTVIAAQQQQADLHKRQLDELARLGPVVPRGEPPRPSGTDRECEGGSEGVATVESVATVTAGLERQPGFEEAPQQACKEMGSRSSDVLQRIEALEQARDGGQVQEIKAAARTKQDVDSLRDQLTAVKNEFQAAIRNFSQLSESQEHSIEQLVAANLASWREEAEDSVTRKVQAEQERQLDLQVTKHVEVAEQSLVRRLQLQQTEYLDVLIGLKLPEMEQQLKNSQSRQLDIRIASKFDDVESKLTQMLQSSVEQRLGSLVNARFQQLEGKLHASQVRQLDVTIASKLEHLEHNVAQKLRSRSDQRLDDLVAAKFQLIEQSLATQGQQLDAIVTSKLQSLSNELRGREVEKIDILFERLKAQLQDEQGHELETMLTNRLERWAVTVGDSVHKEWTNAAGQELALQLRNFQTAVHQEMLDKLAAGFDGLGISRTGDRGLLEMSGRIAALETALQIGLGTEQTLFEQKAHWNGFESDHPTRYGDSLLQDLVTTSIEGLVGERLAAVETMAARALQAGINEATRAQTAEAKEHKERGAEFSALANGLRAMLDAEHQLLTSIQAEQIELTERLQKQLGIEVQRELENYEPLRKIESQVKDLTASMQRHHALHDDASTSSGLDRPVRQKVDGIEQQIQQLTEQVNIFNQTTSAQLHESVSQKIDGIEEQIKQLTEHISVNTSPQLEQSIVEPLKAPVRSRNETAENLAGLINVVERDQIVEGLQSQIQKMALQIQNLSEHGSTLPS